MPGARPVRNEDSHDSLERALHRKPHPGSTRQSDSRPQNHAHERDMMVGLALHFSVAEELHIEPSALFGKVADHLPEGPVATLLRTFGSRSDVTLRAFGWELVRTPHGPDFIPT